MSNARPPRLPRRALHGVLLLDKPIGWTSNDALQKTKGLLRAEKGGHTGTLDPLATGLLPLCFGAATKFSQASLDADKRYTATLHLGRTTSTGDLEGEVVDERPVDCDRAAIAAVLARFTGEIDQLPPMHSALKHQGRALYEYARQGVEVEREPRRVTIRSLAVLDWNSPTLVLDVQCSKGTYVRTLAEDIGRALGCGAHLSALRRTASGALSLQGAVTIAELEAMAPEARASLLRPVDCLVADWPALRLGEDDAGRFLSGQRRRTEHPDADAVRVYGPDPRAFLGSAHVTRGELIADRLLSPPEVASQLGAPAPLTSATPAEAEA